MGEGGLFHVGERGVKCKKVSNQIKCQRFRELWIGGIAMADVPWGRLSINKSFSGQAGGEATCHLGR